HFHSLWCSADFYAAWVANGCKSLRWDGCGDSFFLVPTGQFSIPVDRYFSTLKKIGSLSKI
ncbi:hypothetical protein ACIFOT_32000, partial [Neobacillus sp. NRS-1170]|uniref:hypothetical protein n=1 Tax=Neobacillus sp. NRS-1170 TaxID=3233898 RepID=UPI003D296F5B